MSSFLRRGKARGVTCIALEPDGFAVAHVVRDQDARPRLQVCDYRPKVPGESLEHQIRTALREYGLRGTTGVAVLHPSAYGLRMIDAPDVGDEFMREAVRYSISDLIDFDIDDAVIDLFRIPGQKEQGRGATLYVAAARAAEIQDLADLLNDAGLQLAAIDVSELALRNLTMLTPEDESGLVMVHLQRDSGIITVSREGQLYMTRASELGMKQALDAMPSGEYDQKPDENDEFEELLENLLLEIQRSADYYEHQLGQPRVNHLLLAPLERQIPRIGEFLAENLSMDIRALDLTETLDSEHEIARDLQARCLTAIGGALRSDIGP